MFICPEIIRERIEFGILEYDFLIEMYNYSPIFDNFLENLSGISIIHTSKLKFKYILLIDLYFIY